MSKGNHRVTARHGFAWPTRVMAPLFCAASPPRSRERSATCDDVAAFTRRVAHLASVNSNAVVHRDEIICMKQGLALAGGAIAWIEIGTPTLRPVYHPSPLTMQNAAPANLVKFLSDRDVADLTGTARSTLAKMRLRGDGPPFVRVGASVRYPEDALRDWQSSLTRRRSTCEPSSHALKQNNG